MTGMVTINVVIKITEKELFFPKLAKTLVSNISETEIKYMGGGFAEMGVGVSF